LKSSQLSSRLMKRLGSGGADAGGASTATPESPLITKKRGREAKVRKGIKESEAEKATR